LDVSKNKKLSWLYCNNNELTSLDVSKNKTLSYLKCSDNQLSYLDVSKNKELSYLIISGNQLTSLDVSKNRKLTDLNCSSCKLNETTLNELFETLPSNKEEKEIFIFDNPGTNDCNKKIVKKKKWKIIKREDMKYLESSLMFFSGGKINMTTIDSKIRFSLKGTDVVMIEFGDETEMFSMPIAEENWTEFFREYPNEEKRSIIVYGDNITGLICSENHITSLDVSKNIELKELICSNNNLTNLDVSKNSALSNLDCTLCKLSETALNNLFETLPDNEDEKEIDIVGNPGTNDCDKSFAERKKWKFMEG